MTANVLRQPSGIGITPALEAIFKCRDGILLRAPAHAGFRHVRRDRNAMETDDPRRIRRLVRELAAFTRAKTK